MMASACQARSDAAVAPLDRDGTHAGRARGLHVAQVVAEVDAVLRREREFRRRMEQRCRIAA